MSASTRESKATHIESKEVLLVPREAHPLYCRKLNPCHEGVESKDRSDKQKTEVQALKEKLPLLNKIWVGGEGTAGDWKVVPAQDGSYLAWVEVSDSEYKLSHSQRIAESLYLMQHAQQKTHLPFPVYRCSDAKMGKKYYVLLPHFEKYVKEDLVKAASYCERSWRHYSNISSGHVIKMFTKKGASFNEALERLELDKSMNEINDRGCLQGYTEKKKYTEKKAKKALESKEKNQSKWYQKNESPAWLEVGGSSYRHISYSEAEKMKSILMDYLDRNKIECEFITDPVDDLFVGSDIPSTPEKLAEYRKTIIEMHTKQTIFYERYHIHQDQLRVFVISEYINKMIQCFSSEQYIRKLSFDKQVDCTYGEVCFAIVFFRSEMESKLTESTTIKRLIDSKNMLKLEDGGFRIGFAFDISLVEPSPGMSYSEIIKQEKERYLDDLKSYFGAMQQIWDQVLRECRRIEPADEEITNVTPSRVQASLFSQAITEEQVVAEKEKILAERSRKP